MSLMVRPSFVRSSCKPILFALDIDDHTFFILNHQIFFALNKSEACWFGLFILSGKVRELFEIVDVAIDIQLFPAQCKFFKAFNFEKGVWGQSPHLTPRLLAVSLRRPWLGHVGLWSP